MLRVLPVSWVLFPLCWQAPAPGVPVLRVVVLRLVVLRVAGPRLVPLAWQLQPSAYPGLRPGVASAVRQRALSPLSVPVLPLPVNPRRRFCPVSVWQLPLRSCRWARQHAAWRAGGYPGPASAVRADLSLRPPSCRRFRPRSHRFVPDPQLPVGRHRRDADGHRADHDVNCA